QHPCLGSLSLHDALPISQPARGTTNAYRDHLTQLWLLDPVPAWTPRMDSPCKHLQRVSKHQLADPALAARLLGLSSSALGSNRGAAMAGPLFEALVTLGVREIGRASCRERGESGGGVVTGSEARGER